MTEPATSPHRVRVGDFQIDLDSGEVVNGGTRGRLQLQSLELLKALLECPGAMVSRDELRRRLWPNDTFVDFDHALQGGAAAWTKWSPDGQFFCLRYRRSCFHRCAGQNRQESVHGLTERHASRSTAGDDVCI